MVLSVNSTGTKKEERDKDRKDGRREKNGGKEKESKHTSHFSHKLTQNDQRPKCKVFYICIIV